MPFAPLYYAFHCILPFAPKLRVRRPCRRQDVFAIPGAWLPGYGA